MLKIFSHFESESQMIQYLVVLFTWSWNCSEHPKLDKTREAALQNLTELVCNVPEKGMLISKCVTQ